MTTLNIPLKHSSAYKAAALIFKEGPMIRRSLFCRVDFGVSNDVRNKTLQRAIDGGWLQVIEGGRIDVTTEALMIVGTDIQNPPPAVKPKVAEPRQINVMHREAYKAPKVYRREDPEWAKRPDGFRFYTVA